MRDFTTSQLGILQMVSHSRKDLIPRKTYFGCMFNCNVHSELSTSAWHIRGEQ